MKVIPLAADSLGVRSMATYVEVAGNGILIDPGATIAASRFNLPPAPEEWDALRRANDRISAYAARASMVFVSHYHDDHFRSDPATYADRWRDLADRAFAGLPDFRPKIVHYPAQWALRERRRRRVVIKEVNPAGCRWFVARYYEVSPGVADYIREHSALKPLVRAMLTPLVVVALFLLGSGAAAKAGIGALLATFVVARRRRRWLEKRAQGART